MAGFNWDKFEAEPSSNGASFNWDEHPVEAPQVSKSESGLRGAAQGASLGFADELAGGAGYLGGKLGLVPEMGYDYYRDYARQHDKEAEAANPKSYTGGEFGGSILSTAIPGLNVAKGSNLATTVGKSALQGAVTGAGSTDDLTSMQGVKDVLSGGVIGAGGGAAGYGIGRGIDKLSNLDGEAIKDSLKSGLAKSGKVLTGVDDQNLIHYAENRARVNAAPTAEAIKDSIDEFVGKASDKVTRSKDLASLAKQELDDAYRATTFDLARTRAPEGVADSILSAMDNQKAILGSLSDKADDALAKSGATFEKADLLKFVDRLGKSVGAGKEKALIGDEAVNAVNKLKMMRDRIEGGLGEEIDATTLRDVLRQVRKDINYNQAAGEFNSTLNGLKKDFTRNISDVLKGKSPEYSAYMEKMADMSGNLEDMSKVFGSKEKAIAALNSMGSAPGQTKGDLLKKFGELHGQDFHSELDKFKRAKELLELSKRQDMRGELLPELSNKFDTAAQAVTSAENELEPIKKLSRNSTQNAIRQQGFKTPNIENRRAFEEISKRMGRDVIGEMKDRAVLDSFNKESAQGSRKALMYGAGGTAIGGLLGGPAGAAAGGAVGSQVGGAMDIYGGRVAKKVLDSDLFQKLSTNLGNAVTTAPERFGKFAPALQSAAQRGTQALAATHFILQQTQPEYQSMIKNMNENGQDQ